MIQRFPWIENRIYSLYQWFFKTAPSSELKRFMRNLSWLFIGTIVAKGILFLINVLGGRYLGDQLYGRFTLIVSIANFMLIPIMIGASGSLIKYVAEARQKRRQGLILSTITWFTLGSLIFWSAVYFLAGGLLGAILQTSIEVIWLAISLTVAWTLWSFMDNALFALHRMRQASVIMIITHTIMFLVFIWLASRQDPHVFLLFIPFVINYVLFGLLGLRVLVRHVSWTFSTDILKTIFSYGLYSSIILIATTFFANIDRLMLNMFVGEAAVGVYQAYYLVSITLVGIATGMFVKVFIPTIAKMQSKKAVVAKLNRLLLPVMIITLICLPFIILFFIWIFQFTLSVGLAYLFTLATLFDIIVVLYGGVFNLLSIQSIRKTSIAMVVAIIINIIFNYLLIPVLEITGAVIATTLSLAIMGIFLYTSLKKEIR